MTTMIIPDYEAENFQPCHLTMFPALYIHFTTTSHNIPNRHLVKRPVLCVLNNTRHSPSPPRIIIIIIIIIINSRFSRSSIIVHTFCDGLLISYIITYWRHRIL